ncbi:hypothetical protein [Pseudonocardia sp. TRM90224]|uniref:hypothetical protein n=1 Tax=Pseudonocardia sp. TRM90224 TaxID=2812678 RepID=UPI001E536218|nr:hypothetical protein [Pseudonocardia sp. TRM90224]
MISGVGTAVRGAVLAAGCMAASVLAGCGSASPPPAAAPAPGPSVPSATSAPASDVSCINRINYAGDTRSNAEINSLGEQAGTCPPPWPYRADESCTNWIDYAGDPRSNAEINSEGERTGSCPLPPA